MSEACRNILESLGGYILQERGLVSIKVCSINYSKQILFPGKNDSHSVTLLVVLTGKRNDEDPLVDWKTI